MTSDGDNVSESGQNHKLSNVENDGEPLVITIKIDDEQRIVFADQHAESLFGLSPESLRGKALGRFLTDWAGPGLVSGSLSQVVRSTNGDRRSSQALNKFTVFAIRQDGRKIPLLGSYSHDTRNGRSLDTLELRHVSARQRARTRLAQSHEELRQLSTALQTIREEERKYIARELHDDLGQVLATLKMDLVLLQNAGDNRTRRSSLIRGMVKTLDVALNSVHRIATNLRPRSLDEGSLYFALQELRQEFSNRYHIFCEVIADENDLNLDDEATSTIYRIVQESLTNIARHANASNVSLTLHRVDGELLINICDDGKGIAPSELKKHGSLGLVGMRERVWGMRGEIIIESDGSKGTSIDIMLPIADHLRK